MGSGVGATSTSPVKYLLEQTIKHCHKLSVAKKERSSLAERCTTLRNHLDNNSLGPHQSTYDALRSHLTEVEGQLSQWSKYNFLKSLIKRKGIKAGVIGFVLKLESIASRSLVASPLGRTSNSPPAVMTVTIGRNDNGQLPAQTTAPDSQPAEATIRIPSGEVTRDGNLAFAEGEHCELWKGQWVKDREGSVGKEADAKNVALKALRIIKPPEKDDKARERLMRELPGWAELRHQNLLPFHGIVTDIGQRLYMIFPWRENGNLLDYVKQNDEADKHYLLRGSAAGLSYLHSRGVIHGSVKCKNVLISQEGEPQICDFQIPSIMGEINEGTTSKTTSSSTAIRHAAPELLESNNQQATIHSDTYSFAMLIIECITEDVPFSNITRDAQIIHIRIGKKQLPPRPDGAHERQRVSDELWNLMTNCWAAKPEGRPTMDSVHRFFLDRA